MHHEIKPLHVQIINQIAAGEVIEGPFSAVKELVENAIDAQSTEIMVDIQQGGKKLIAITDNGIGIPGEQIKTAFLPHTTSKLRTLDDLQHIQTLGFRGEALASIAAVAKVEVFTRAEGSLVGFQAHFENGIMQSLEEIGCPVGTKIVVRDLFHQTPARLKFMKSDGAETSRITEMLTRLALSRPQISFQYSNNNKIMLTTRKDASVKQTVLALFPQELAKGLTVVNRKSYQKENYEIHLHGLIGQPEVSRGNRNYQIFFVNGRNVKNDVLCHAFERAYEGSMMARHFPVGLLYMEISPTMLDVNVHPSKTTIKFLNPEWVEATVLDYVQQALRHHVKVSTPGGLNIDPTREEWRLMEERRQKTITEIEENIQVNATQLESLQLELDDKESEYKFLINRPMNTGISVYHDKLKIEEELVELVAEDVASGFKQSEKLLEEVPLSQEQISQQQFLVNVLMKKHYRLVGQVFTTYILIESDNYLYMVDQHAAHERVVYDQLLADVQHGSVEVQEVLDGQILELTLAEMEWFRVHEAVFKKMGFIVDSFGHQAIRLRGVPYHLGIPAHAQILEQFMDELIEHEWSGIALPMDTLIRKACRYAIKAHDKLTDLEIDALLEQMTQLKVPLTCPHGRPIVMQLRKYDLEKLFKRV